MKMNNAITISLDLLNGLSSNDQALHVPNLDDFNHWLSTFAEPPASTLADLQPHLGRRYAVAIRLVDPEESRTLNRDYRDKDAPTNILSFPTDFPGLMAEASPFDDGWPLGDIAICAERVMQEAEAQGKSPSDHWAHLTLHGVLHLLDFDHHNDADAAVMERLETQLLASLGIDNPYVDLS